MFGSQAIRLLREMGKWSADLLAQELYAMLGNDDIPLTHTGGLTLDKPADGSPAITIRGYDPGDTVIKIVNRDTTPTTVTPGGGISTPGGSTGGGGGTVVTGSANTFPGTVQSGTGHDYVVEIITETGTVNVNVYQIQIDPSETIPAGTGCLVCLVGGNYYMQVGVWL